MIYSVIKKTKNKPTSHDEKETATDIFFHIVTFIFISPEDCIGKFEINLAKSKKMNKQTNK